MQHDEHRVAVFLDLRPLVAVAGVLDGEFMQVELFLQVRKFLGLRIFQRHPDETFRAVEISADIDGRDMVGEPFAILIGEAVNKHVGS